MQFLSPPPSPLTLNLKLNTRRGSRWEADWLTDRLLILWTAEAKWALSIKGRAVPMTEVLTVAPAGLARWRPLPCRGGRCWSAVPCRLSKRISSCRAAVRRRRLSKGIASADWTWQRDSGPEPSRLKWRGRGRCLGPQIKTTDVVAQPFLFFFFFWSCIHFRSFSTVFWTSGSRPKTGSGFFWVADFLLFC